MTQRSKCRLLPRRCLMLALLFTGIGHAQELFAPSVSITANSQNAVAAFNHVKQVADSAFNAGHHRKAFDTYLTWHGWAISSANIDWRSCCKTAWE